MRETLCLDFASLLRSELFKERPTESFAQFELNAAPRRSTVTNILWIGALKAKVDVNFELAALQRNAYA